MATKIILSRKSEFMNKSRKFRVFIDGEEKEAISNGGSEEYLVDAGTHTMETKIDWCGSPAITFDANEGETIFLKARSGMKYLYITYFLAMGVIVADFILRKPDTHAPWWWFWLKVTLVSVFVIYFLYYLTLGRKKYLALEEDKNNVFQ